MKHALILLTLACMVASGCEPPPKVAVAIAGPELTALSGTFAPTVPIRGSDGKLTTLQSAVTSVYIVAFVPAAYPSGCGIDPRLSKLADELWQGSVSVIQITQPAPDRSLASTGTIPCPPPPRNGMLVLDPDRIAWCAFGGPAPGTVLLIDSRGKIVDESDLDNLENIYWCASYLSHEVRHAWEYSTFIDEELADPLNRY